MENRRAIGTAYEDRAVLFLQENGYEIVERNYRCRTGEIDIIAKDGRYLVFAEVKYRRTGKNGSPAEAVDVKKQRVISRTALHYLMSRHYGEDMPVRFDVVSIQGEEIKCYQNAFPYQGGGSF